jgi:hypothetical protein
MEFPKNWNSQKIAIPKETMEFPKIGIPGILEHWHGHRLNNSQESRVNSEFPILRIPNFVGLRSGAVTLFFRQKSNNLASRNNPKWNSQKIGIPKKLQFSKKEWNSQKIGIPGILKFN